MWIIGEQADGSKEVYRTPLGTTVRDFTKVGFVIEIEEHDERGGYDGVERS